METDFLKALEPYNYWGNLKVSSSLIKRNLYLEKLLEQKETDLISAVIGVRRSGKSTILLQVLAEIAKKVPKENTLFINMEEASFSPFLSPQLIKNIIEQHREKNQPKGKIYVVIDEVQNVEKWELALRNLIDAQKDLKIYITGSSAQLLGQELGTKLSGRYLITEVFPLNWQEYKQFKKKKKETKISLDGYFSQGGFPKVVLEPASIQDPLLEEYFNSILLRDISQRYSIRNIKKLKDLAVYLFSNNSNLISIPRFIKLLDLPPDTVGRYFEYIQNAYLGFFVPKFAKSLKKQIYNPKKFYGIDLGLTQAISFKLIDNRSKQLENLVFLHLRQNFKDIFYFKEKQEVDFLVRQGIEATHLINVAFSIKNKETREREINGLREAMLNLEKTEATIVTCQEKEIIEVPEGQIKVTDFENFVRNVA